MAGRAATLALLLAAAAALPACSNDKPAKAESNIAPTNYRKEVIDTLKELFVKNETVSVTNALISEPALQQVGGEPHYSICVRYAAHAAYLNVIANVERIGYFYNGHLNQLVETTPGQCATAAYKPFPELNEVCLGKGCR